jgi:hypothetical protein
MFISDEASSQHPPVYNELWIAAPPSPRSTEYRATLFNKPANALAASCCAILIDGSLGQIKASGKSGGVVGNDALHDSRPGQAGAANQSKKKKKRL